MEKSKVRRSEAFNELLRFASGLHNWRMIDVMMELASVDMRSIGVLLRMKDGRVISFTSEAWGSGYENIVSSSPFVAAKDFLKSMVGGGPVLPGGEIGKPEGWKQADLGDRV